MENATKTAIFHHVSIMVSEVTELLSPARGGLFVDGTLGGGGHSEAILRLLPDAGRLIGIDRDETALAAASARLAPFADRFTAVHGNFFHMRSLLLQRGITKVDGVLLDLGVSSYQLDNPERGFSYMHDAPLDMRMDQTQPYSAYDVINGEPFEELRRIISLYGEERFAGKIASSIVKRREQRPIETTLELVDVIKSAMPAAAKKEKQHPAKRSFQAVRIQVNGELRAVETAVADALDCLNPGGRCAVISFHSLEDRIVKHIFVDAAKGCTCPKSFPVCVCGNKPKVKIITKNALIADDTEQTENPRARSAKLRVAEKL